MATGGRLDEILGGESLLGLAPAELLGRFVATKDEAAFAALVARHGPMVLATCRRMLPDPHDADDAFQATFLVLARRAPSIGDPDRLAPWLHGVARRVAARSRTLAARRRAVEGGGDPAHHAIAPPADHDRDLRPILDEELARLPSRQRDPIVLCHLDGLTHDEAATRLGWPVGTVRSRLARGRDRLRNRLARRGVGPAGALTAPALAVPPALIRDAARVALGAGAVPARVLSLARGASIAMTLTAPKTLALAAALALGFAAGAARALAPRTAPAPAPAPAAPPIAQSPAPRPRPAPTPPEPAPVPETSPLTVAGRALDAEGRPVAGARIYLNSCVTGASQRLAETRTDAAGAYRFEGVPLPIRPEPFVDPDRRIEGVFQILGAADGLAFAWDRAKHVRFGPIDQPLNSTLTAADYLAPGATATVDLTFPDPRPLTGRVVDDRGNPLADASVGIAACARPRRDQPVLVDEVDSFRGVATVPPDLRERRTDADGRFTFENLPPDLWVDLHIQPRGFPSQRVAATMAPPAWPDFFPGGPRWDGSPIVAGPIEVVCPAARDVPIRVVAGDTGRPLAGVFVQITGSAAPSDADGRVTLRAAPGEHQVVLLPKFGTDYVETEAARFVVPPDGAVPPVEATLEPALIVEATVTDADTGGPIAGVGLWEEGPRRRSKPGTRELLSFRSFEAPRLVHSDRPITGADGKLRAPTEPGPRRFGVGLRQPPGWAPVDPDGVAVDGKPGETARLDFRLRWVGGTPRP